MSSARFRKIGFFGPGRRLAAPEGPKIVGGASLARRENQDSLSLKGPRSFEFLCFSLLRHRGLWLDEFYLVYTGCSIDILAQVSYNQIQCISFRSGQIDSMVMR
jgi:hypothetical protein